MDTKKRIRKFRTQFARTGSNAYCRWDPTL